MERKILLAELNSIFSDVFDNENLKISETTTSADVEGWDSLAHITLIAEIEEAFKMKFMMKDVIGMKNVGEMLDIIERETA
ncbi:hypothetical protein SDC9_161736 [bioreactor metagenome]|uniref:Carrier domain-containing protein n=1 Tax=bioreactor metagenome TaxID=1076179 RepID=A0A645FM34_9ZZZZ|nr:acyl carrier protein [Erysipelotrichaceae bacterium]